MRKISIVSLVGFASILLLPSLSSAANETLSCNPRPNLESLDSVVEQAKDDDLVERSDVSNVLRYIGRALSDLSWYERYTERGRESSALRKLDAYKEHLADLEVSVQELGNNESVPSEIYDTVSALFSSAQACSTQDDSPELTPTPSPKPALTPPPTPLPSLSPSPAPTIPAEPPVEHPLMLLFVDDNNDIQAAMRNGTEWETDRVDNPHGSVIESLDAARDNQGNVHVSYRGSNPGKEDYEQSDLYYATNASGRWRKEEIFESDGRIGVTAIEVDDSNAVHIVYGFYPADAPKDGQLWYITNETGSWEKTLIDENGAINNGAIALDSSGNVHTAYTNLRTHFGDNAIRYARRDENGEWSKERVVDFNFHLPDISIAIDSNDTVHLAYARFDPGQLHYLIKNNGGWSNELIRTWTTSAFQTVRLVLDADDMPHLILSDVDFAPNVTGLLYYTKPADAWVVETVPVNNPAGSSSKPTLLVGNDGQSASVSFGSIFGNALQYAERNNGVWSVAPLTERNDPVEGAYPILVK